MSDPATITRRLNEAAQLAVRAGLTPDQRRNCDRMVRSLRRDLRKAQAVAA